MVPAPRSRRAASSKSGPSHPFNMDFDLHDSDKKQWNTRDIDAEQFVKLRPRTKQYSALNIIGHDCCEDRCNYRVSMNDIIWIRSELFRVISKETSKSRIEYILHGFIRDGCTTENDGGLLVRNQYICWSIVSLILGLTLTKVLRYSSQDVLSHQFRTTVVRPISFKRVKQLGIATKNILQNSQPHPCGGVILNPSTTKKSLLVNCNKRLPIKEIRKYTRYPILFRKSDSLTRCDSCCSLKEIIKSRSSDAINAEKLLKAHLLKVDRDRVSIRALEEISKSDHSICCLHIDAMSNATTKLPVLKFRPKAIADDKRLTYTCTGIQEISKESSSYETTLYTNVGNMYSSGSSYIISILLEYLSKMSIMPRQLYIITDNYAPNRSQEMLAACAYIIESVTAIEEVTLLQLPVGHTHSSIDAFYGTLSQTLKRQDVACPDEFDEIAKGLPSTRRVVSNLGVYSFNDLVSSVNCIKNRMTHHQFRIQKMNGEFKLSIAPYISSSSFSCIGNEHVFSLFNEQPDFSTFKPKEISPKFDEARTKIVKFYHSAKHLVTPEKLENTLSRLKCENIKTFSELIEGINQIPAARVVIPSSGNDGTFLEYLKKRGYPISTIPQRLRF